jgi:predicted ArsR family transcriptional regulator
VAAVLLEQGSGTAAVIAERLGLTQAAVRRHLDSLLASGLAEERSLPQRGRRGRGRPARVFRLSDAGREAFQQDYDDLATAALRYLADTFGPGAVEDFARTRAAELERRYLPVLAVAESGRRPAVLARALSADGYAAAVSESPVGDGGAQLCQHHCPVAHVASQYPQLCEAETEVFSRLLGTQVQRLATIAHGDGVCTTHVSPAPRQRARSSA